MHRTPPHPPRAPPPRTPPPLRRDLTHRAETSPQRPTSSRAEGLLRPAPRPGPTPGQAPISRRLRPPPGPGRPPPAPPRRRQASPRYVPQAGLSHPAGGSPVGWAPGVAVRFDPRRRGPAKLRGPTCDVSAPGPPGQPQARHRARRWRRVRSKSRAPTPSTRLRFGANCRCGSRRRRGGDVPPAKLRLRRVGVVPGGAPEASALAGAGGRFTHPGQAPARRRADADASGVGAARRAVRQRRGCDRHRGGAAAIEPTGRQVVQRRANARPAPFIHVRGDRPNLFGDSPPRPPSPARPPK